MIDIRISPPRDGARGGQENFTWDDIKSQHSYNRECYLGQTIKLGVLGRRGQFIKHDWYLNEKSEEEIKKDERKEEIELIQKYEECIMQEMLGNRPHKFLLIKNRPKIEELRKIFNEEEKQEAEGDTLKSDAQPENTIAKNGSQENIENSRGHKERSRDRPRRDRSEERLRRYREESPRSDFRHERDSEHRRDRDREDKRRRESIRNRHDDRNDYKAHRERSRDRDRHDFRHRHRDRDRDKDDSYRYHRTRRHRSREKEGRYR